MWKCPDCKRIFTKNFQPHFCGKPTNVDEYIQSLDETKKSKVLLVRKAIQEALPDALECISWSMPTYKQDKRNIIHFASFKNHIGIYPGVEAIIHFKAQLETYHTSKGAIQFPYDQIDYQLIQTIAKWNDEHGNK